MAESDDHTDLQRQLEALQTAHPELDPLAALVLLAMRESVSVFGDDSPRGLTTALLSRRLGIEHALIRRAAADLEALGWIRAEATGGASPALRLHLIETHPPNE